jgi:hypothetical protein
MAVKPLPSNLPSAGLISARPTATGSKALYYATDVAGGTLFVDSAAGTWSPAVKTTLDDPVYSAHGLNPAAFRQTRAAIARARAGLGDFRFAIQGDSIVDGGTLTSPATENMGRRMAYLLAANTGLSVRQGMIPLRYFGIASPQWTVGSDWTGTALAALDGTGGGNTAAAGTSTTLDFAPTDDTGASIQADSFIIYAWGGSGATPPQWSIDGGAYTALTSAGVISPFFSGMQRYVVSAGSLGTHTLHLKAAASGSATIVLGAEAVNSSVRGIRWLAGGAAGSQTLSVGAISPIVPYLAYQPDLMMYEWNTNDYGAQVALATFQARVQNMMQQPGTTFATAGKKADCLWLAAPPQGTFYTIPQQSYYDTLDAASDATGVPVHHLDRLLGSYAIGSAAPLSLYSDTIHMNAAGHNFWAASVAALLALL